MAKFVVGEDCEPGQRSGPITWHKVDEAGPDAQAVNDALGSTVVKTLCGKHFGADPVNAPTGAFPLCTKC